ncbi:hypothetical protein RJ640_030112 [Escallonia rubra]|uniref:Smr domain-containing protein n=1 Tax=Escallonia rubra TaxID=112253 RepID=A0AA88QV64_9ASTE|nr:hypothetical protein RJ640_030112 [Escallonia rubra]
MELCNTFGFTAVKPPPPPILCRRFKSNHHRPTALSSTTTSTTPAGRLALAESLQNETLQTLEWPSVCDQLTAFTSTAMGSTLARTGRVPLGRSPDESRKLLAQTAAAVALPRPLDFSRIKDVSRIVDVSVTDESCQLESCVRYSPLLEILQNCNFLMELEQKIGFCIDCTFSMILDRASEDLEIIRSERKRNMENLELLLKQVSARIFQAGGMDRPLVTKRRSRMCVGVRSSRRSLVPGGVVLNVSSSGATYFMEPKEAVDLNNMEVRLSNSEKIEEQAILSLLTSEIAEFKTEIKYLLDKILEVDFASARAAHARWMNGVCPVLSSKVSKGVASDGSDALSIDVDGIQHPLLLETSLRRLPDLVASRSRSSVPSDEGNDTINSEKFPSTSDFPVPIDIKIKRGTRVVVISGPNTGGKTASMKTLGLSSVMLKAGMFLPARNNPRLPWFDLILADIGDHQSLEQNLSTFSGHLSRLCKILEVASDKSLILIDEIGSGTDPSEGVALSASILQYLKGRVNLAVVTTHYADLSCLKEKDNRFENAAMEFSLETLQPTYRILWGSTGESNALNIAKSIGFDKKVIERAQTWVGRLMPEKDQKRKGLLYLSLVEERSRLEMQARRAASLHADIMNLYNEIQDEAEDIDSREAALKAKESQQIQGELNAAKSQIETVVKQFENRLQTAGLDQFNSLLKTSESEIASIVEAHRPTDFLVKEIDGPSFTPQVGEQVLVKELGNKLATVVEAPGDDDTILVQYGKLRVRASVSSTRALPGNDTNTSTSAVTRLKKQGQRNRNFRKTLQDMREDISYGPVVQTSKNTVDLRGMRVEEASHHLNMAIGGKGSNSVLFVIHGMGTGILKECTYEILRKHPRVSKFEQESPTNYGCTVAYIK